METADSQYRIRAATLDEVFEHGIVGLRLARVAKKAGVSLALVHRYFGDRDGLLAAVLGTTLEDEYRVQISAMRDLAVGADPDELLSMIVRVLPAPEDEVRRRMRRLRLMTLVASDEIPELRRSVEHVMREAHNLYCDLARILCQKSGNDSLEIDNLGWLLHSLTFGFSLNDFHPDHPLTDVAFRRLVSDLVAPMFEV